MHFFKYKMHNVKEVFDNSLGKSFHKILRWKGVPGS